MRDTIEYRRGLAALGLGLEVFEIHPIVLGGDPTDPANKCTLTREQRFEAVRYWNQVVDNARKVGQYRHDRP